MGCVYLAKNRLNGKCYVGKTTVNIRTRMVAHLGAAKRGTPTIFARALAKYGSEGFEWTILFESNDGNVLFSKERELVAALKTQTPLGYNITIGGEGMSGWHPSIDTRLKISRAKTGRIMPEEEKARRRAGWKVKPLSADARQQISYALLGRRFSEETRAKIRASKTGLTLSQETRAKISTAKKGKKMSAEWHEKQKHRVVSEVTREKLRIATKRRYSETNAG